MDVSEFVFRLILFWFVTTNLYKFPWTQDRFGFPMVLESTFKGVRLRRFDERVCHSYSKEITVVQLNEKLTDGQCKVCICIFIEWRVACLLSTSSTSEHVPNSRFPTGPTLPLTWELLYFFLLWRVQIDTLAPLCQSVLYVGWDHLICVYTTF